MSFLNQITQGVTLRKTQSTNQPANHQVKVYCDSDDDYNRLLSETSFDRYYQGIKEFTFQSVTLKISIDEALALIAEFCDYSKNFRRTESTLLANSSDNIIEYVDWKNVQSDDEERNERRRKLLNLAQRIDQCVVDLPKSQEGFFCRLSTMSPKDVATNRLGFIGQVLKHYNELLELEKKLDIDFREQMNRNVYALYKASTSVLKLREGLNAVQLLIESERAQQELQKIASGVYGDSTKTNELVLREWCTFDVAHEFRAFICNKKLTGITQYNPFVFFPQLIKQKAEYQTLIQNFLEKDIIHNPSIEVPNFIVDIIIVENESGEKEVKIVEINPFAEFAGTCLFTWENDRDILTGKRGSDVEFRLVTDCVPNCEKEMGNEWKDALVKLKLALTSQEE